MTCSAPWMLRCILVRIAAAAAYIASSGTALPIEVPAGAESELSVERRDDRLVIHYGEVVIADFVFTDPHIRRPYFCNLRTPRGFPVTRTHPPVADVDATDHDTMHPGLWLAFGDVNGEDFWRNKARIEHLRFSEEPMIRDGRLWFRTESRLVSSQNAVLGHIVSELSVSVTEDGAVLVWDADLHGDEQPLELGDQEEMGFGTRVATPLTEKNGGVILNSEGRRTAAETWGQAADWCDYSGKAGNESVGITLMSAPGNFRRSWWHNRDYGLMVANPFGRAAMQQGAADTTIIPSGKSMHLRFAAVLHDSADYRAADAYDRFVQPTE